MAEGNWHSDFIYIYILFRRPMKDLGSAHYAFLISAHLSSYYGVEDGIKYGSEGDALFYEPIIDPFVHIGPRTW